LNPTLGPQVGSVLHKALSKTPADRYENCTDFVGALSAACNATPGWMPLPRGASLNMPTVGSQDGMGATIDDRHDDRHADRRPTADITLPMAIPQTPPPQQLAATVPLEAPPIFEPRARREASDHSNKVLRNVLLSAAAVALLMIGIFFVIRYFADQPRQTAAARTPSPQEAAPPPPDTTVTPVATPTPVNEEKKEEPPAPTPVPPEPIRARAPQKPAAESDFQVTTSPAGANVTFDGDSSTHCKSPCTASLPPGRHTFLVQHAGYRDEHRIIEVPRDAGLMVDLARQMGSLSLITNPPGLTVVIDGKEQAQKTPANLSLTIGSHHVQVLKGSDKQEFTIDIRDGLLSSKFIEWTQ